MYWVVETVKQLCKGRVCGPRLRHEPFLKLRLCDFHRDISQLNSNQRMESSNENLEDRFYSYLINGALWIRILRLRGWVPCAWLWRRKIMIVHCKFDRKIWGSCCCFNPLKWEPYIFWWELCEIQRSVGDDLAEWYRAIKGWDRKLIQF